MNRLYYGDNLDVLRNRTYFPDECVDLIYLDPPFNSNRAYNVLFKSEGGDASQAQIQAFDDTWTWSQETEHHYLEMIAGGPRKAADALVAMRGLLGESDMLAYLSMMTVRLVELHRVLKTNGTLYLHCDPTASHYLKIVLDAIFGPERFLNEVIWKRTSAHNRTVRYGPVHDVLLVYGKGEQRYWQEQHVPYGEDYVRTFYRHLEEGTGRRYRLDNLTSSRPGGRYEWNGKPPPGRRFWGYSHETMTRFETEGRLIYSAKSGTPQYKRYLDEMPGQLLQDVWTDVPPISSRSAERLGYPTQKPLALMKRILTASCPPGGVVLDPFCGCGTTVAAAQELGLAWRGIDVTYLAVDLIDNRLRSAYGADAVAQYEIVGTPRDSEGALALFNQSPFEFERWAVSLVDGTPNEKQVGDRGTDGVVRFPVDKRNVGRALVSVKGGKSLNPGMVRDLVGTVQQERADLGIFICMTAPTAGMRDVARRSGEYLWPVNGRAFPKVQIITVKELLGGLRPSMPTPFLPYVQAQRLVNDNQLALGFQA